MMQRLKYFVASLVLSGTLTATPLSAQGQRRETDRQIEVVERGLRGPIQVASEPVTTFTLSERMDFYAVPGVSIAVIENGRIAWTRGYGTARPEQPVTPETRFSTGSVSKAVTAVAAMRRVEAGALSLDADINQILREWRVPPSPLSAGRPVTLRGLLSHGAGLSVHGFYPGYQPGAPLPTNIQILNGQPPAVNQPVRVEIAPGSAWRYSGGGYQVVQQLLTEDMRTDFPTLMSNLVFQPLGMNRSSFEQFPLAGAPTGSAVGHGRDGTALPGGWGLMPEMAAAGLWSTASDLARLTIALQRSWRGQNRRFLSATTTHEMFRRQIGNWGLGFELQGQGRALRFRHFGDNPGYKAVIIGYPETGQGAVILTNGDRGSPLIDEILFSIAAAYGWPDYGPRVRVRTTVDPATLARFEGTYQLDTMSQVRLVVARQGEELTLRIVQPAGEQRSVLLPSAPNRFFRRDIDFELRFADGAPSPRLTLHQAGQTFEASRIAAQ
jgi:CubicO group peptidase (beta-lactamase class C family)